MWKCFTKAETSSCFKSSKQDKPRVPRTLKKKLKSSRILLTQMIMACLQLIATYVFFSSSARLSRRSQDKPSSNLYPRSLVRSSDSLPCSLLARSFGNLSHCSAHQSGHFSARHSDHLGEHPTAPQQLMRSIRLPNSQA